MKNIKIILVAGVQAQCPASFSYVGGRCLWFMTGVEETIAEATATCQFFGAELAKVDDCHVLGEIAAHIEASGEEAKVHVRKERLTYSSDWDENLMPSRKSKIKHWKY